MLKSKLNQANYGRTNLIADDQQHFKIPNELKCGEIYYWLCAGELYAVACKLCEDQPLCPLSEFLQHMEIWHTEWQTITPADIKDDEEKLENTFCNNIDHNVLFKGQHQLKNGKLARPGETLEPLEYLEDLKQPLADTKHHIVNKQQSVDDIKKQRAAANVTTQNDGEFECLTDRVRETREKLYVNKTKDLSDKPNKIKIQRLCKNNRKVGQKYRNYKRKLKAKERLNKTGIIAKTINKNLTKIKIIKRTLSKIVRDMNDLKENAETTSETNDAETTSIYHMKEKKKSLPTNYSNNKIKSSRSNCKRLKQFKQTLTTQMASSETNGSETEIEIENSDTSTETNKTYEKNTIKNESSFQIKGNNAIGSGKNDKNLKNNKIIIKEVKGQKPDRIINGKEMRQISSETKSKFNENRINSTEHKFNEKIETISGKNENKLRTKKTKVTKIINKANVTYKNKLELKITNKLEENTKSINENRTVTVSNKTNTKKNNLLENLNRAELCQNGRRKAYNYFKKQTNSRRKLKQDETGISKNKNKVVANVKQTNENESFKQNFIHSLPKACLTKSQRRNLSSNEMESGKNVVAIKTPITGNVINENETNYINYLECAEANMEKSLKINSKSKSNENSLNQTKTSSKQDERKILKIETTIDNSKATLYQNPLSQIRKSLRILNKNSEFLLNCSKESEVTLKETKESERALCENEAETLTKQARVENTQEFNESSESNNLTFLKIQNPYKNKAIIRKKSPNFKKLFLKRVSKRLQSIKTRDLICRRKIKKKAIKILASFNNAKRADRKEINRILWKSADCQGTSEVSLEGLESISARDKEQNKNFVIHSESCESVIVPKINAKQAEDIAGERYSDPGKEMCLQKEKQKEDIKKTMFTQFITTSDARSKSLENLDTSMSETSLCQFSLPISSSNSTILFPLSPQTEEEHFEIFVPKEKLNREHISHLIKLYREETRLWDQSHPEFCEPQVCRKSWQQITEQWNEFCHRKFTIAEVRIRICTLCQRFVQERDRLALEGEIDECPKFPYYEQMQFLEQQKSLQRRRELYDQQNEKILEVYQQFPILWHINFYKMRKAKERDQAMEDISQALKLYGLHLSAISVQKRIRSLRKCYRLEKIRHLHAQVEQTPFESVFRHYERMKFLSSHMEPFVCRSCGKIFEHLRSFRQHLQTKKHGSVLPDESETETDLVEETEKGVKANIGWTSPALSGNEEIGTEMFVFSPISTQIDCFTESENSTDILERFTPLCSTPTENMYTTANSQQPISEYASPISQEDSNFPMHTPEESITHSLHLENQIIEEIMENVTSNDSLIHEGLNQLISTVTNCEGSQILELTTNHCEIGENLSPQSLQAENSFVVQHPDIVTEYSSNVMSLSPIATSFTPLHVYAESELITEHPDTEATLYDTITNAANEDFLLDLQPTGNFDMAEESEIVTVAILDQNILDQTLTVLSSHQNDRKESTVKELNQSVTPQQGYTANILTSATHVVEMQNSNISIDPKPAETLNDTDNEMLCSADIATIPLPEHLIHKMIEVYRKYPQLWDPNHLDFNSRILRRQAWCSLTTEFNSNAGQQVSWRTLHRKLTDYVRYYKKLISEQEDYEQLQNKWAFYEDFKFLDDVIGVNTELLRSVHHRENSYKIIAIYKTLNQLWDTKHPDYSKRGNKQRNIEILCNTLQEEYNLQLTTERLKNRLIELRTQYRMAKKQRLKCVKNKQQFSANDFEFYEALNFLDDHIDPFTCDKCEMEFKKRTDYNQHLKKEHVQNVELGNGSNSLVTYNTGMENICHTCGQKFTTRSNLVHHLKRHDGIRNYACSMCPKKFYASHSLKVHIRSHTKECPYTCEKCGMSFVSASKLNQHAKRHLNKKDFICEFCPKAFFTGFEKDRHERRHLNIRDKACPVCGKTFVAGSSYYAHLMLHNETKRFECDNCDMKFAQYAGLYKHKKRHH